MERGKKALRLRSIRYNTDMPESPKVQAIFESVKDTPKEVRPFIESLVVSRIAAHFERGHDKRTGMAWEANTELLDKELQNPDKEKVLERALFLVTLPKHENEESEWYFRWLRGNGLSMFQDERMREPLIALLDDPERGRPLVDALNSFLTTNVDDFTMDSLSDVPEVYSLLASFLVCSNFEGHPISEVREQLIQKATKRLTETEVSRVMDFFNEIDDTKVLYQKYKNFKEWITY